MPQSLAAAAVAGEDRAVLDAVGFRGEGRAAIDEAADAQAFRCRCRAVLIIDSRDCCLPCGTASFMPRDGLAQFSGLHAGTPGRRAAISVSMPAIFAVLHMQQHRAQRLVGAFQDHHVGARPPPACATSR